MKEKSFVTLSPGVLPAKMYSNLVKIKNRFFLDRFIFYLAAQIYSLWHFKAQ
jgi:hypothetical protein